MNTQQKKSALKLIAAISIICTLLGFKLYENVASIFEKPEENRFTRVVLAGQLEEPIQFEIMKDGKVLIAERKGKLKLYDPLTKQTKLIAHIPVSTKCGRDKNQLGEGEDGLQGVLLDPNFENNNWIYLYYSAPGDAPINSLARYELKGDKLLFESRKVLLDVVTQREECFHVGGGMLFDKNGNMYLSTGDNTFSRASDGFTPIDERPGEASRDAQKSSGNTNDLRGKILRIHPETDGTYTIPEGNLFPKGTDKTRPEIYIMGVRNPWRLTIDSKTGWLYWGEVGPDGGRDDPKRGPRAYDEFNQARQAGNFGWPYFGANNKAYGDYDFATNQSGELFDPLKPVNNSPNNTGLQVLPPAQPSLVWYPYDTSPEFPELGSGGRSATGGPIYHRADFKNPKRPYPEYYEGKWFVTEWVRGWIVAITMDENGNYKSLERFLPNLQLKGPIDMEFGPDGDLYVLEYGNGYFQDNPEASLVRIEYNAGNRTPIVQASASKTAGAIPFKVSLSSAGTQDYDRDQLKFEWKITHKGTTKIYNQANPSITLASPGKHKALLTVTDSKGAKNSKTIELIAGNEPPVVKFDFIGSNKTFFFPGTTVNYNVSVFDKEDGSLANKKISSSQVAVSIDYLAEGYDLAEISQSQRSVDASVQHSGAIKLINGSDCKACHAVNTKSLGPAFMAVAQKYKNDPGAQDRVAKKIITGGSGVWGDAMMPAHTSLSQNDANSITKYILSLGEGKTAKSKPVKGTYKLELPKAEDNSKASYVFRAAYTDRGTRFAPAIASENMIILRSPFMSISQAKKSGGLQFNSERNEATIISTDGYLAFNNIDLTGIKSIEINVSDFEKAAGAEIEVHADSPTGILLGKSTELTSPEKARKDTKTRINLIEMQGQSDLYIVFKNKKGGNQRLMRVTGVAFRNSVL
jgi:cytochrome c